MLDDIDVHGDVDTRWRNDGVPILDKTIRNSRKNYVKDHFGQL